MGVIYAKWHRRTLTSRPACEEDGLALYQKVDKDMFLQVLSLIHVIFLMNFLWLEFEIRHQ